MSKFEYRPLRVVRELTVTASSLKELARLYPNAKPKRMHSGSRGDVQIETIAGVYYPKQFIDLPTTAEREVLTVSLSKIPPAAVEIPQHADGYDVPTSGVARSREGSLRGQQIVEVVKTKALVENAKAEKTPVKSEDSEKDTTKRPRPKIKKSATEHSSGDKTRKDLADKGPFVKNPTTGGDE